MWKWLEKLFHKKPKPKPKVERDRYEKRKHREKLKQRKLNKMSKGQKRKAMGGHKNKKKYNTAQDATQTYYYQYLQWKEKKNKC